MTDAAPTLIGLELLVPDIGPAVQVFTEAFGCEVAWEGRSSEIDADVAVLDAGAVTITLVAPTETGGPILPDPSPRLSQLVFGAATGAVDAAVATLRGLGLAVAESGRRPFVPPGVAEGVLGAKTALVLTPAEQLDSGSAGELAGEL